MEKAWDFQALLGKIKGKALPIAGMVAGDVIDWAGESLQKSENKFVQVLGGVVIAVKPQVIAEIDKAINGHDLVAN